MRTRRSLMPNGAIKPIKLPSQAAPPRGAMASPKTVITTDLERGGSAARDACIHLSIALFFILDLVERCRRSRIYIIVPGSQDTGQVNDPYQAFTYLFLYHIINRRRQRQVVPEANFMAES